MTDCRHIVSANALADALDRLAKSIDDLGEICTRNHYLGRWDGITHWNQTAERSAGGVTEGLRERADKLRAKGAAAWTWENRHAHRAHRIQGHYLVAQAAQWLSGCYVSEGVYEVTEPTRYRDPQEAACHDVTGVVRPGKYHVVNDGHRPCYAGLWDGKNGWFGTNTRITPFTAERVLVPMSAAPTATTRPWA